MDEKELAKQLSTYADAVAAFAFVQGVAFALLMGQQKELPTNVAGHWCIAAPIIAVLTCGYFLIVCLCHSAEDKLIGIPSNRGRAIGKVVPLIRGARFLLIIIMGAAQIVLVIGLRFYSHSSPC